MIPKIGTAHIMIFTRFPELGRVKTRMIDSIGAQAATNLMTEMGAHVGRMTRYACALSLSGKGVTAQAGQVTAEGLIAGPLSEAAEWLGIPCAEQGEGSMGERMQAGFAATFQRGSQVVAIVGGDCPELTPVMINRALVSAQNSKGAAIITATDGGYCLLALHRNTAPHIDAIFADIDWSTEKVAAQQRNSIESQGFSCAHIAEISDIDRVEDMAIWERIRTDWYGPITRAQVVVPTLNEESLLSRSLPAIREYVTGSLEEQLPTGTKGSTNVKRVMTVVADGGSTDKTLDIAKREGARIVTGYTGRAAQLNAGALVMGSKIETAVSPDEGAEALVFLHADTLPVQQRRPGICSGVIVQHRKSGMNSNATKSVSENPFSNLSTSSADVVSLTFGFLREHMSLRDSVTLRIFEFFTRLRPRFGGLPYGDQGFFCRRAYFEAWGGFPSMELLEDFEFARRAAASGGLKISGDTALTSSRRYRANGPFALMRLHRKIVKSYLRGASAGELADMRAATRSGRQTPYQR